MLRDITIGQHFPGNSVLHRCDPRLKLVATIAYIVVLFVAPNPLGLALSIALLAALYKVAKIPGKLILKSLKPIVPIVLFTAVLNLFFVTGEGEPLVHIWVLKIYGEGIRYAILLTVRVCALIAGTSLLTYTTSPIVLTDAIENLLRPLAKIHFPVHELAMMMTIALRFIPTLIEETEKIMNAQKARGAMIDNGTFTQRIKALHARIDADASPHRSKRARIVRWAGWSAAAMLGVALVVGGYLVGHDMHKAAMESYYTFTNTGRKPESLRLLDGTQVWLAQGSTLSYGKTFSPHDRTVKLDGEAFFDVASDRDHPFFVKTNTVVVKVVGTSFNVKMYKDTDDTEVVLERGVVKLQFGDNDNMITMQPGQKIYYSSASHDISISEVNVEYLMLLKYGMISMSDVRVAEIIRKVEEIYSVDIETVAPLDDDRLYNFNFLKSNTLDDVLDIIEKMSGVKCRPAPAAGAE